MIGMRILVSGAAGFIGSHLVDSLLQQGHDVVGVDNFCTGHRRNIAHLESERRFTLLEQDVVEPLNLAGPIDRIFHLASPASPVAYARYRVPTMKVNSRGTWNLLDLAVERQARLLVVSTSEIYGEPNVHPQPETYWGQCNSIGLRSMYEESKRFAEALAMAYHREQGADTRIVRLFAVYGPRMDPADGRVVTSFIGEALRNVPIVVSGDGTQSRSFCYVSDTVRGMIGAMEADFHEPINIGNPEETTILQLAREVLAQIPDSTSKITFGPRSDYDPRTRCPDIRRAKQILAWTPQVTLKDGLARVIEHMRAAPGGR